MISFSFLSIWKASMKFSRHICLLQCYRSLLCFVLLHHKSNKTSSLPIYAVWCAVVYLLLALLVPAFTRMFFFIVCFKYLARFIQEFVNEKMEIQRCTWANCNRIPHPAKSDDERDNGGFEDCLGMNATAAAYGVRLVAQRTSAVWKTFLFSLLHINWVECSKSGRILIARELQFSASFNDIYDVANADLSSLAVN